MKCFLILIYMFVLNKLSVKGQTCTMLTGNGVISSPNHPGYYYNYLDICWIITGDGPITLTITAFNTEYCCDDLRIYNGGSNSDPQIVRLRGTSYPPQITTTSNDVYIAFHSDYSITRSGFRIEFSSPVATTLPPTTLAPTTIFTTEGLTTTELITTPVPEVLLPLCERQPLIDRAPKVELLIIDDDDSLYVMSSTLMTYNNNQYIIDHSYQMLDVLTDFPLTVHLTTVIYEHQLTQISGVLIYSNGVLLAEDSAVSSDGYAVSGPVFPVFGHHLDIGSQNVTYIMIGDTIAAYNGDMENFPWFMPLECFPRATTPVAEAPGDGPPMLLIFFLIALGISLILGIAGCVYFCTRSYGAGRKQVSDSASNRGERQPGRDQRITVSYHR